MRLHTADPVGVGAVDDVHQLCELVLEEATRCHLLHVLVWLLDQRGDEGMLRRTHQQLHVRLQRVAVLLQPVLHRVVHAGGVVVHDERVARTLLDREERVRRVHVQHLCEEGLVCPGGAERTLVVQLREDAATLRHHVETRRAVGALHFCHVDALRPALVHVLREDEGVVVVLQRLVRKVDAQLLERVVLEVLESEDVEQSDPVRARPAIGQPVDLDHLPRKKLVVRALHDGIPGVRRLHRRQLLHDRPVARLDRRRLQLLRKRRAVDLPELRSGVDKVAGGRVELGAVGVDRLELNLQDVEHACDGGPHAIDVARAEAAVVHRRQRDAVVLAIVDTRDIDAVAGIHVVPRRCTQLVLARVLTLQQQVETVVHTLVGVGRHDTRLLQQILDRVRTHQESLRVELHLHELPESRRVVVPHSLRVAEALEHGRRLVDVEGDLLRVLPVRLHAVHAREGAQVLHHNLRRLRLARPRLARDEDGLVLRVAAKVVVRVVRLRPRVRRAVLHDL
eukprot:Rhum_TRINITY_DN14191_c0_g2::Rhum_TRINITY_DN14191_c0_g2_i1::g.71568::m.71568